MDTDSGESKPSAPAAPVSLVGATLDGRYRLLSTLGAGAMGDVYLAEHVVLGKKMAVKVLKHSLSENEELVRRFQQEAVAASRIGHENIVDVTDFGRAPDGSLYFVMEALDGQSVRMLIGQTGGLELGRSLGLLQQLSRALAAAHAAGIVHRDLKVDNLMVVRKDDGAELLKVLDFGISKVSSKNDAADARHTTQAGVVLGTPDYMSPEQIRGEPVDLRSDIYSFGVVAHEMVTGLVPFDATNMTGVMMKHLSEVPLAPSQRRPELALPVAFDSLVLKSLEKDPAQRFQSMLEVSEALTGCQRAAGLAVATVAPLPIPAAATLVSRPQPVTVSDGIADTWKPADPQTVKAAVERALAKKRAAQRSNALPIGLGLTALLVAAGAWWAFGRTPVAPPPPQVVVAPAPVVRAPPPEPVPAPAPMPTVAPEPTPEPPVVVAPRPAAPLDTLSAKDVGKVFASASPRLQRCFQANKAVLPSRSGRVGLHFTVLSAGTVSTAGVTTPVDAAISECVAGIIRGLKFPRNKRPSLTFDMPLDYALND